MLDHANHCVGSRHIIDFSVFSDNDIWKIIHHARIKPIDICACISIIDVYDFVPIFRCADSDAEHIDEHDWNKKELVEKQIVEHNMGVVATVAATSKSGTKLKIDNLADIYSKLQNHERIYYLKRFTALCFS